MDGVSIDPLKDAFGTKKVRGECATPLLDALSRILGVLVARRGPATAAEEGRPCADWSDPARFTPKLYPALLRLWKCRWNRHISGPGQST